MKKIENPDVDGATGYIGEYVASTMEELEEVIKVISHHRPTGRTTELLYLIGMVKLAAFDVQGIIPLPHITLEFASWLNRPSPGEALSLKANMATRPEAALLGADQA